MIIDMITSIPMDSIDYDRADEDVPLLACMLLIYSLKRLMAASPLYSVGCSLLPEGLTDIHDLLPSEVFPGHRCGGRQCPGVTMNEHSIGSKGKIGAIQIAVEVFDEELVIHLHNQMVFLGCALSGPACCDIKSNPVHI